MVTPTGSSFGSLDPSDLSRLDKDGAHLSGPRPTKEMPLHNAFYRLRGQKAQAVVHLHSHYAVRLSVLEGVNPVDVLPSLTPYTLMQNGRVHLVPYYRPGDPALGRALEELPKTTTAVILANHGPIVAGPDLDHAVFAMEELEASARLALDTLADDRRLLTDSQILELIDTFNLE